MKQNMFWVGDGLCYARHLTSKRKLQQIRALKLMGVTYYYDNQTVYST